MYKSMSYGVYVFFASCLVLASVYAYFFIHETKGLRMDQMDHLFGFERQAGVGSPLQMASYESDTGKDMDNDTFEGSWKEVV